MREQYLGERSIALDEIDHQLARLSTREPGRSCCVPCHEVISGLRKADPGMSTRAAKHVVMRAMEAKEFSPTENADLPRLRAVLRTSPMHRFTPFTDKDSVTRALSPSPVKSKQGGGLKQHYNYNLEQFTGGIRKNGPVTYHGLDPPTIGTVPIESNKPSPTPPQSPEKGAAGHFRSSR